MSFFLNFDEILARRKPGAKPRRVIQDAVIQSSVSPQRNTSPSLQQQKERDGSNNFIGLSHLIGAPIASESPGPKSSGSEDNDSKLKNLCIKVILPYPFFAFYKNSMFFATFEVYLFPHVMLSAK